MRQFIAGAFCLSSTIFAGTIDFAAAEVDFRALLGEMIAADTTNPPGNEARIVKIVAERFKKAGITYEVQEFAPGRQNLIARLKGSGSKKPLMLLAHTDVVGVADQIWSIPNPHVMTESQGFLYGRGVSDDLAMAAGAVEVLILLKNSGLTLERDVIVGLTGDEEAGGDGMKYALEKTPDLIKAEITLNEGGGLLLQNQGDAMKMATVQVGEKIYDDFVVTAKGMTGHSSVPQQDNAIYKLARGLARLDKFSFPIRLSPVLKNYLQERARFEKEPLASAMLTLAKNPAKASKQTLKTIEGDLGVSTLIRTTCVVTMINGGTKENALAAIATANINCRILPDDNPEDIKQTLVKVMNEPTLEVRAVRQSIATPASPIEGDLFPALKKVLHARYPGLAIIPTISRGATDSKYLREKGQNSYGFNTFAISELDARLAHGVDERMPVVSLRRGIEILYEVVNELAVKK